MPFLAAIFSSLSVEAGLAGVAISGPAAPIVLIAVIAAWAAVEIAKHENGRAK